jgi:hypothetical protein
MNFDLKCSMKETNKLNNLMRSAVIQIRVSGEQISPNFENIFLR